jgi:4-hydroxybenzoate polyprenyltransferase
VSTVLPDAAPANWVDRFAPERLRPWLKLARLDRPTGIWLLMIPGWQGIALADAMKGRWPDWRLLLAFALGAVLMRSAGCAVNDAVDRDLDAQVARTAARPVASGRISRRAAVAFALACTLVSAGILLFLNLPSVWLAAASLPLVGAYPFMKRITWWPQAWLGLTFNWGALLGFAAARGGRPLISWALGRPGGLEPGATSWGPALLLYAAGIAWTLGYDTIYAMQDVEDDALAGVKSSARRLGAAAPRFVSLAYIASLCLALTAGYLGRLGGAFAIVVFAQAAHFGWQGRRLDIADARRALAIFRSNTWAGLILFSALALGHFGINPTFSIPG